MECNIEGEGMHYEGICIRPPSEAFSILLQVTTGCSHNKCTFCGTYKGKRFRIKEDHIILSDILFASRYMKRQDVPHGWRCPHHTSKKVDVDS